MTTGVSHRLSLKCVRLCCAGRRSRSAPTVAAVARVSPSEVLCSIDCCCDWPVGTQRSRLVDWDRGTEQDLCRSVLQPTARMLHACQQLVMQSARRSAVCVASVILQVIEQTGGHGPAIPNTRSAHLRRRPRRRKRRGPPPGGASAPAQLPGRRGPDDRTVVR